VSPKPSRGSEIIGDLRGREGAIERERGGDSLAGQVRRDGRGPQQLKVHPEALEPVPAEIHQPVCGEAEIVIADPRGKIGPALVQLRGQVDVGRFGKHVRAGA